MRARNLCCTTSVDDSVIADEVADNAEGIVNASLDLFDDHVVASTHKDGDSVCVLTVLDNDDVVLGGAKLDLSNNTSLAQLVSRDILKARDDTGACGDSQEFNLCATYPADGWELVLEKEVVCLVIKAPLADDQVRSRFLDLLDHLSKPFLLSLVQLLVLLGGVDLQRVLGLRFGRFERTRQDDDLGVLDSLRHLGVAHMLIQKDTTNQLAVLHLATGLSFHFDQAQVHILSLKVSHR